MWQCKKVKLRWWFLGQQTGGWLYVWRAAELRQQKIALFLYLSIHEMRMRGYILLCSTML